MAAQELSPLALYGDRAFFQEMLDTGCDEIQIGGGPWINEERVVHIFCFLKKGEMVAALSEGKDQHFGSSHRGRDKVRWSTEKEAKAYLDKWKISLGKKGSLRELVELWDAP